MACTFKFGAGQPHEDPVLGNAEASTWFSFKVFRHWSRRRLEGVLDDDLRGICWAGGRRRPAAAKVTGMLRIKDGVTMLTWWQTGSLIVHVPFDFIKINLIFAGLFCGKKAAKLKAL